jgi:hypothetical protein
MRLLVPSVVVFLTCIAAAQQPPGLKELRLSGTVRILDEGGRAPASGALDLLVWTPAGWDVEHVTVRDGRWTAPVRRSPIDVVIGRMELEGRAARRSLAPNTTKETHVRVEDELVVDASWTKENRVRAFDAATGAEIHDALCARKDGGLYSSFRFPVVNGPAPLLLPEWTTERVGAEEWMGRRTWWIRAPGYAWAPIDVDHARGGEWKVSLAPGGDLELKLAPKSSIEDAFVNISCERDKESITEWPDVGEPQTFVFQGVPVGPHTLTVDHSADAAWHDVYSETIYIERGATTSHVIALGAEDVHDTASCRGTLRIPIEWGAVEPRIELDVVRPEGIAHVATAAVALLSETDGRDRVWHWRAGERASGTFRASIAPALVAREFSFDIRHPEVVELSIPKPVSVRLRVLDDASGEVIRPGQLSWCGLFARETLALDLQPQGSSDYAFWAAPGPISISLQAQGYGARTETVTLVDGPNDVVLRVRRSYPFRLVAVVDGERVPPPANWSLTVTPVEGKGRVCEARSDGEFMLISVDRPGVYSIAWAPPIAERALAPVIATASSFTPIEVELPLRRAD